ncbi:peptidase C1B, bleomycin hydrolase [Leucosporidium creatinivorum]|uniref:Cysteine proteinase 1, mitochondrial n=1 Tax=Leucosporidium creatinivorum TaxID=106004 RepID=A0A1Y2EGR9_9BASI|nr:peptidase C1B, bleomycin hydrolase [Leucosporidium creatinivorum]
MGSAASQPQPLSEKSYTAPARREPASAADLLASLSLRNGKAPASPAVTSDNISSWADAFEKNPKNKFAQTVVHKQDFLSALVSRKTLVNDQQVFNVKIPVENQLVANQKSSGRCWLFAMTNIARLAATQKYGLAEDFELSQSYLFFVDSLSKANYFLEQMLDLAEEPLDDRTVQYLMVAPENDGGQFQMAVNIVEQFGLVPQAIFPESFHSSNTSKLDGLLTSKLREYALELRSLHAAAMRSLADVQGKSRLEKKEIASQSARKRKEEQMEEVYRILAISLGTPPKPDDEFTWEYYDKDKKYHKLVTTPLKFYKEFVTASGGGDLTRKISLIHDPRNEFNKLYTVSRLGNVVGGDPVLYINTEIKNLKDVAITLLKQGTPVWFGCDVGKSSNSTLGVMDTALYDLDEAFSTRINLTKAERISTGDSAMTHAMVLTAVHLDDAGKPVRWRVENSWGPDACTKGYMLMSDDWFSEHVFQVVADRRQVPKELVKIFETDQDKATVLPPWDPMGALAVTK